MVGYQNSDADIAYTLRECPSIEVLTPTPAPDPAEHAGWCFPDTEDGILDAVGQGATHLWANGTLFASHPLQTSRALDEHASRLRVVGQGPLLAEKYDDKSFVNDVLRRFGRFHLPEAMLVNGRHNLAAVARKASYPVVVKPARGQRGQGVKVCHGPDELVAHAQFLLLAGGPLSSIMIEAYLEGEEITVTVMPPKKPGSPHWALPIVTRFGHRHGIAPDHRGVAILSDAETIPVSEEIDPTYKQAVDECERAAQALRVTAPISIDARRRVDTDSSPFAMFDVNIRPVSIRVERLVVTSLGKG